jgi:hypothetical protein
MIRTIHVTVLMGVEHVVGRVALPVVRE